MAQELAMGQSASGLVRPRAVAARAGCRPSRACRCRYAGRLL